VTRCSHPIFQSNDTIRARHPPFVHITFLLNPSLAPLCLSPPFTSFLLLVSIDRPLYSPAALFFLTGPSCSRTETNQSSIPCHCLPCPTNSSYTCLHPQPFTSFSSLRLQPADRRPQSRREDGRPHAPGALLHTRTNTNTQVPPTPNINTCARARAHTHTHARTHAKGGPDTHAKGGLMPSCSGRPYRCPTCTHTRTHTHTHTHKRTHAHAHAHAHAPVCVCARAHTLSHARTHMPCNSRVRCLCIV
jgi:hypothetical protein